MKTLSSWAEQIDSLANRLAESKDPYSRKILGDGVALKHGRRRFATASDPSTAGLLREAKQPLRSG